MPSSRTLSSAMSSCLPTQTQTWPSGLPYLRALSTRFWTRRESSAASARTKTGVIRLHNHLFGAVALLEADAARQVAQAELLQMGQLGALLQTGHAEKLGDQGGHLVGLPVNHEDGFKAFLRRFVVFFGIFAGSFDDGDGGAQLVGGVCSKLPLGLKGGLQTLEHAVEGAGKAGKFVLAFGKRNAARQVAGLVDGGGCLGNALKGEKLRLTISQPPSAVRQRKAGSAITAMRSRFWVISLWAGASIRPRIQIPLPQP